MRRAGSALMTLLDWLEDTAMVIFMTIATSVTLTQVVFRYGLNSSLYWAEEVVLYSIICMSFVGASMGVRRHAHISVEALHAFVRPEVRRRLEAVAALLGIAFGLILLMLGWQLFSSTLQRGMLSPAMRVPMGWVYFPIPVAGALITIRYIALLIVIWRGEPHEHGIKEDNLA
jgi:C4-dicarboxylate transporter, DctQ subunit